MGPKRVALITGAGSGIGRAVAIALANADYRVVLTGRREAELHDTAHGLNGALVTPADVTDPVQVNKLFERTLSKCQRLDVLFNNAGMNIPATPFEDLSLEQWNQVMNVNATGAFLCAQAAFRLMQSQDPCGGRIINNGSISAYVPRPHSAAYTASKHAVAGLTKTISLEGRAYDIACSQIDIGNAATAMTSHMSGEVAQADGSLRPEPTIDVQHVAAAVVHMASLPLEANIQFLTIMATKMPFIGRG